jgi:hypothetical protein
MIYKNHSGKYKLYRSILTTEKLSDTGKNYFLRIEDAAERMRTLIEDLLSFQV